MQGNFFWIPLNFLGEVQNTPECTVKILFFSSPFYECRVILFFWDTPEFFFWIRH
ncbi:hypothetical protein HanRHA438_Chr03g0144071 [Helianthus annuus]|nr:hypothetical protein HanRHA438_Chr03g0144071 [Helianthus annuus]